MFLLLLLTILVYAPAMRGGFIWDDDAHVEQNATLRTDEGLARIWLETGATPQYYPLVHTTFWIEYHLWRLNPAGYHVVNILLHALCAILLWRVLRRLGVPGAFAAAAIFAVHPVNVESVAWITERKNVLSATLYFAAALSYLAFATCATNESPKRKSRWLYAAALLLFVGALLSKTITCTLPVVLLLVIWWKRWPLRYHIRPLIPFFVVGASLGLVTVWLERAHVGAVGKDWNFSFLERLLIAGRALCFYARKLVWPANLTFIYPRWDLDAVNWHQYVYPAVVIGVVGTLWSLRRRLGRGPLVAVACFAVTLFPALGFFNVYPMVFSFVADHFQYLATPFLIALLVAGACLALPKRAKTRTIVAVALVAPLAALTWRQAGLYTNAETLWRDTLAKNPAAWMAHHNLGKIIHDRGEVDEAIRHYRRAIELNPDYLPTHYNLANALVAKGRLSEAVDSYRKALALDPQHGEIYCNLGIAFTLKGDYDEALRCYRKAVELKPNYALALYNMGVTLAAQGALEEAIVAYRQSLQANPFDADAYYRLGVALDGTGDRPAATVAFKKALQLHPGMEAARRALEEAAPK